MRTVTPERKKVNQRYWSGVFLRGNAVDHTLALLKNEFKIVDGLHILVVVRGDEENQDGGIWGSGNVEGIARPWICCVCVVQLQIWWQWQGLCLHARSHKWASMKLRMPEMVGLKCEGWVSCEHVMSQVNSLTSNININCT